MRAKHRLSVPVWALIVGPIATVVLSSLLGWAIGKGADAAATALHHPSPLNIQVTVDVSEADWALPSKPADVDFESLSASLEANDYLAWMVSHHAVPIGPSEQLIVSGTGQVPVVIESLKAVGVDCSKPATPWTGLTFDRGGGADPLPLSISLRSGNGSVSLPQPNFDSSTWRFPRQVSTADADIYDVYPAAPPGEVCSFELEFTFDLNGHKGNQKVTNNGRPFQAADADVATQTFDTASLPGA